MSRAFDAADHALWFRRKDALEDTQNRSKIYRLQKIHRLTSIIIRLVLKRNCRHVALFFNFGVSGTNQLEGCQNGDTGIDREKRGEGSVRMVDIFYMFCKSRLR